MVYERSSRRDVVDESFDPSFGSRLEFSYMTERERLAVLLHKAGVRFDERDLGSLAAMCFRAAEEIRRAEDSSGERLMQRLEDLPGWDQIRKRIDTEGPKLSKDGRLSIASDGRAEQGGKS
jgi:hypothetical protein